MYVNEMKFERNIFMSVITWPVLGKQNIEAKEVVMYIIKPKQNMSSFHKN